MQEIKILRASGDEEVHEEEEIDDKIYKHETKVKEAENSL